MMVPTLKRINATGSSSVTTFTHQEQSHHIMSNEMAGGESTASNESPPEPEVSDHVKKVLGIKFPRCSCCGIDWCSLDADDDEGDTDRNARYTMDNLNPSATESSPRSKTKPKPKRNRPSHTKLLPLPQCQCTIRMIGPLSTSYENSTEQSPREFLSNLRIHEFPNLAICRACLEKKISVSNEVQIYDYRQDNVENGQRSIKYSIEPKCDQCKQSFMKRTGYNLVKLENEGKKPVVTPGIKKKGPKKHEFNWFDFVEGTIKMVEWMKQQKRRGMREERKSKRNMQSGDGKPHAKDWWVHHGCSGYDDGYGSSDACFSFSSDSDSDVESMKPKGPPRQIAQDGELLQEYRQRREQVDEAYRKLRIENAEREKEDHEKALELAKKLETEAGPNNASYDPEQIQKDIEMAKKLEAELKSEDSDKKKKMEEADRLVAEELAAKLKEADTAVSTQKKGKAPTPHDKKRKKDPEPSSSLKQTKLKTKGSPIVSPDPATASKVDSDLLSELIGMGFTRDKAERCLRDADGDVNLAATMLLSEGNESNEV